MDRRLVPGGWRPFCENCCDDGNAPTDIHLPLPAVAERRSTDGTEWIQDHAIPVGRPWWTRTLTAHGFADTLTGETIRRADIFALAATAPATSQAAKQTRSQLSLRRWRGTRRLRSPRSTVARLSVRHRRSRPLCGRGSSPRPE